MWHMAITRSGVILYCILAAVVVFGALVSLSNTRGIRGYRNVALLLAYVLGIVSLFVVPFLTAVVVWVAAGVIVGLCYAIYEVWSQSRASGDWPKSAFEAGHLIYGPLAWPLMFMEVVEYTYAELKGPESGPTGGATYPNAAMDRPRIERLGRIKGSRRGAGH
jgi:hypothetical protein